MSETEIEVEMERGERKADREHRVIHVIVLRMQS